MTGLAAALVAVGVGWLVQRSHDTPPARRSSSVDVTAVVPGRTVYVDSGVPSTTFLPLGLGPQDGRTLSAQRAYNVLVSDSAKLNPIPATVRPYYGLLTDGSASPMVTRRAGLGVRGRVRLRPRGRFRLVVQRESGAPDALPAVGVRQRHDRARPRRALPGGPPGLTLRAPP